MIHNAAQLYSAHFYASHFSGFHDQKNFRVREILLVSSPYDAFVLEEDGRIIGQQFTNGVFNDICDLFLLTEALSCPSDIGHTPLQQHVLH